MGCFRLLSDIEQETGTNSGLSTGKECAVGFWLDAQMCANRAVCGLRLEYPLTHPP